MSINSISMNLYSFCSSFFFLQQFSCIMIVINVVITAIDPVITAAMMLEFIVYNITSYNYNNHS